MAKKKEPEAPVEEAQAPVTHAEEVLFDASDSPQHSVDIEVNWKASEYIHHEKNSSWYFGLLGAAILVGVILYLVNDDLTSFGGITSYAVLAVMTAAIMVYANRKPETLEYHLDPEILRIGDREYLLDDFRSFSIVQDGGVVSVTLAPLKRFMPPVSLYYDPNDEENIINILASVLPHEETELDFVDRLIRKVRF